MSGWSFYQRTLAIASLGLVFTTGASFGESDASKLLRDLRACDDVFRQSSVVVTGTDRRIPALNPDTPIQEMRWKLALTSDRYALVQESQRVLEQGTGTHPQYPNSTPTMLMKRILVAFPEYTGQHSISGRVLDNGPTPPPEDNMVTGRIRGDAADSTYFSIIQTRFIWYLGRGFSSYINEIHDVITKDNGLIEIHASGKGFGGLPGTWIMEVDPTALYMVRSARFFPEGTQNDAVSSAPALKIECTGTLWSGNLCVPSHTDYAEAGLGEYPVEIETFVNDEDESFFEECALSFLPPYEVQTTFSDLRHEPKFHRFFSAGQALSDTEIEMFESLFASTLKDRKVELDGDEPDHEDATTGIVVPSCLGCGSAGKQKRSRP